MNRVLLVILSALLCIASSAGAAEKRVIVGFRHAATVTETQQRDKIHRSGGRIRRLHKFVNAISATLSEEEIVRLKNDPDVAYVESDPVVSVVEPVVTADYAASWGVQHIGADKAVAMGVTGAGVKVAVLDTGIDYTHPDLAANYKGGYNFIADNNDPFDDAYGTSHGTHVAGIIAALNNGTGVVGVAPGASLYAVKVLDGGGGGYVSTIIAGIEWAIENKMNVINISIGSPESSTALEEACNKAYQAGIVIVASAGNYSPGTVLYPAAYDSVIAVSATYQDDTIGTFSSYGPQVELAAPGHNILSTAIGGGYITHYGTSQAAPHVAGVAALLFSKGVWDTNRDGRIADEIRARLVATARDLGITGRDIYYGYGLVDAEKAVLATQGISFTIARTRGAVKADEVVVPLPAGSYTITVENDGLQALLLRKVTATGAHRRAMTFSFKRHSDGSVSYQFTTDEELSLVFCPLGSPGTSADIVVASR
ncbi:peptidase S8 [Geotalea uraniireducens]|uniref:Peptidase S8 n=1 Tax=Geotalea uraniireducens TaxID=351604 RepID=A0ABM8ENE0_9BACT|nr:S8 family peptidase [Geotalea uraniireducens]BDV43728.1 peptidase S8 [Geotalea uraniireducens]